MPAWQESSLSSGSTSTVLIGRDTPARRWEQLDLGGITFSYYTEVVQYIPVQWL